MNEIQVTVRGNVATDPKYLRFDDGNTLTSFRLASNERFHDRERNEWIVRATTYVTVNCRRGALAANVANSVRKGQPVMVTGRLRERFWTSEERSGQTLVVDADSLGHDLFFGAAQFQRTARAARIHSEGDDQVPTDVTGFTVLEDDDEDDVTGVHDAELVDDEDEIDPEDEEQDEDLDVGAVRPAMA